MANITKEERERRERDRQAQEARTDQGGTSDTDRKRQEGKLGTNFGGPAYANIQDELEQRNAIDERLEDRRPGTLKDNESGEAFEDNRRFAGDLGKAANQMIGRAFITENASPHPGLDNPYTDVGGVAYPNLQDPRTYQDGDEVVLQRNYQPPPEKEGGPLPERLMAGSITRLPRKEAKKLVNLGAAKFTEEDVE
jgi:hypothetical protein